MAQIPEGRLVELPYKPKWRDCAMYFSISVYSYLSNPSLPTAFHLWNENISFVCISSWSFQASWKQKQRKSNWIMNPQGSGWTWKYLKPTATCGMKMILLMAEILRSPVEVGSLSQYLQGFSTIPGGFLAGFRKTINSKKAGYKIWTPYKQFFCRDQL